MTYGLSGEGRNRTADTAVFSRVLYQLSYLPGEAPSTIARRASVLGSPGRQSHACGVATSYRPTLLLPGVDSGGIIGISLDDLRRSRVLQTDEL